MVFKVDELCDVDMCSTIELSGSHQMDPKEDSYDDIGKRQTKLSSDDVSLFELIAVTSFNLPYGLIIGTFGLWLLPAEAQRLFPLTQSLTLGLSLGIVGVSQLICPIAGKLSDLHVATTRFGKRRPSIVWGCVAAIISTFGMWQTSLDRWGYGYYFCLFTGMVGLNIAYAVDCGLVPDFFDDLLQGRSSAILAVHTLLGSGTGFGLVMISKDNEFHYMYIICIVLVALTCWLTCFIGWRLDRRLEFKMGKSEVQRPNEAVDLPSARHLSFELEVKSTQPSSMERPRCLSSSQKSIPEPPQGTPQHHLYHDPQNISTTRRAGVTLADIIDSFKIDTSDGFDFLWVFIGRTMYYVGVSVQAFMLYYLRDVIVSESGGDPQFQLGCIALIAQTMAACVAYPIGKYIDQEQRQFGKKFLIYAACLSMCSVYLGFLLSPLFGSKALLVILLTAVVYGAGTGCFLAVDYALALATIPKKEKITQALGIWGVSAFIGSTIGPLVWGLLIESFGRDPLTDHYHYIGYAAMLIGGMTATVCAGAIIKLVKNTD